MTLTKDSVMYIAALIQWQSTSKVDAGEQI
jgi:hypothetical protein